ncbi:MAG: molybdopterin-dependent oxidoreductase [Syntrophorhabdaceae bacterium]|nr:molybdopterin-dependent oxidoreductase [Syntrophorhabdaceae bacterium]
MGKEKERWLMDRRGFLKTTGAGIIGAAFLGKMPFQSFTFDEAMAAAEKEGERAIPTFCAMCGPAANCGVYAFVKNGRFIKVAGMKESPVNMGGLCAKAQAAPQWVYSPDRLKYPMKRIGAKGEGKFQRISWDEAIGIIAETLKEQKKKYGPESLGILSPARRTYSDYLYRFLIAHGSPNYGHSGICAMQMSFVWHYTVGDWPRQVDYGNSDLVLVWGKQPIYSGPAQENMRAYMNAKARGARLIAIKPSVEPDVGHADEWVPIRPGTDAALALGMLHVVVNEDLIDKEFVDKWCYGYEELKKHIQKYPPSWAEKITGIPEDRIKELARLFAKTKRAGIDLGNGVEHVPSSNDAIRAVAILVAITGHLDRPGGNVFAGTSKMPRLKSVHLRERYTQEWVEKLVYPEFPKPFQPFVEGTSSAYYGMFESVLTEKPYPLRTIIAPGTQALASTRGSKRVMEAMKKLDFYVVVDVMRTSDMAFADIVVPVATPYEIDHPFEVRGNFIMARNKVIEPLGEYKSIFEFFCDLGVKMGYGDDFWGGSMVASQNDQLKPLGMTIDELRKHPTGIRYEMIPRKYENYERTFTRPSPRISKAPYLPQGKVAIYNTSFKEAGFNPLPEWKEPPESLTGTPELTKKYPLILSDYHTSSVYTASWQRNVPYLREILPYPTIHIHPDAASARGIKDGDWVKVESPHGWLKVKAEIYPGIRPDTVMILHGWWQGCKELGYEDFPILDGGANVNIMYSVDAEKAFDPIVTAMSSQTLVEVSKI